MNLLAFRGAVFKRYRTQEMFGEAIKWHRNKVSKIMNGKYIPDVDEVAHINDIMNFTEQEYREIFLS